MENEIGVLSGFLNTALNSGDEIFERFSGLEGAIVKGKGLERFVYVPGKRSDRVVLSAHADTVWKSVARHSTISLQEGVFRSGVKGVGIGADDRAGCAIVWLLKDLGHSLLIFDGEEDHQLGSRYLLKHHPGIMNEINNDHQFAVSFDRKNGREFKCYDVGSDEFRRYIMEKTGYREPDRSSHTDIVVICEKICGVNLSVGYYNPHYENESLNVNEWLNTLNIARNWFSEPGLPRFVR